MLRKRSRSHQKDQHMGHDSYSNSGALLNQKHKNNSFFNVPGLFVGLSPKGSESDSVRSPTSPLDFRVFSKLNLGNPLRSVKPFNEGAQKSWDCKKLGLSIVDSLDNEPKQLGKVLRSSDSKNILFGPQMRIKNPNLRTPFESFEAFNSLSKNYAISPNTQIKPSNPQMSNSNTLFGIEQASLENLPFGNFLSSSLDSLSHLTSLTNPRTNLSSENFGLQSGQKPVSPTNNFIMGGSSLGNSSVARLNSSPIEIGSRKDIFGTLLATEIELSEDYTCVRKHGPNPKTTHIYGDCILERHNNEFTKFSQNVEQEAALALAGEFSEVLPYPSNDFLSFCFSCKKKLEGEDIYMYRGEKAFCGWDCRSQEILIGEEMEKTNNNPPRDTQKSNSCEELFGTSMFIAT